MPTSLIDATPQALTDPSRLYFLEKRGAKGDRSYTLLRLYCPLIQRIICWMRNLLSKDSWRVLDHSTTVSILTSAANDLPLTDQRFTSLGLDPLRSRARLFKGIESTSHRRERLLQAFRRGIATAKIIGKGLSQAGAKPTLLLDPAYISEVRGNEVHYVSALERPQWAVDIVDGRFYKRGVPYFTGKDKELIGSSREACVLAPNGQLYVGPIEVGKFHHSSFLAAGAVLFAGEIETNIVGRLVKITNRSGHYKPQREHLLYALNLLKQRGVDLTAVPLEEYTLENPRLPLFHPSAEDYCTHFSHLF